MIQSIRDYENLKERLGDELGQALYDAVDELATLNAELKQANKVVEMIRVECARCNLFFTDEQIEMMKAKANEQGET